MADEQDQSDNRNSLVKHVGPVASETAAKVTGFLWSKSKQLGTYVGKVAKEKADDVKQRLAEAPITQEEKVLLSRYRDIVGFLPKEQIARLPALPSHETQFNRREFHAFLGADALPDVIAFGERVAAERAQQAQADRLTRFHERLETIEKFYANTLNDITIPMTRVADILPANFISQAGEQAFMNSRHVRDKQWLSSHADNNIELVAQGAYTLFRKGGGKEAVLGARFQRSLMSMSEQERSSLRLADILKALEIMTDDDLLRVITPIVWNRGECLITVGGGYGDDLRKREAALDALKSLVNAYFGEAATGMELVKSHLATAMAPDSLPPSLRATLERFIVSGARWMMPAESLVFVPDSASASILRLGAFPDGGAEFLYDMRESLITIAAPGTGKSQAQVLRNLLYLQAPAVVLDVKGEMRDRSAAWHSQNVGPVHVFSPASPATSLHYNPLDQIPTDPEVAWDAARRLADLLVVPAGAKGGDDYFESRGRDMITTAVLDVALSEPAELRTMSSVLDRLYVSDDALLLDWFNHLKSLNVPQLRRQAEALVGMPPKQREGIFDSARRQLEIWQSPAIERLTTTTTFNATELRANNATLYLCVGLEDIKKYASVLRVIIGQTVQALCRAVPESGARPVTFFLDELPRLGRMDVIEEALDIGRGYGVRLWMFCQNEGQLETAYPNAEGMIKNCAIRAYMNPDEQSAQALSRNLGTREALLEGTRKPLAEASALSGPDFANQIIIFGRSSHAARLDKRFAYADPVAVERMNTASPGSLGPAAG